MNSISYISTSIICHSAFHQSANTILDNLHGRLDLPELQPIFSTYDKAFVVSISNSQRRDMPQANWLSTIHHGLPETLLTPNFQVQPHYLAFLGRICPEKVVDQAIRIAGATGMKLRIAAKIDEVDRVYFEKEIKALFILPHVEYIGEISEAEKSEFLVMHLGCCSLSIGQKPLGL
jgi:glycosyltransferase involved in cell wall biosynthesis